MKSEKSDEMPEIDLPEVTTGGKAKPRIHVAPGESSCLSCEG